LDVFPCLRQKLRQPLEPIRVPHPLDNAAHVQLNGSDRVVAVGALVLAVRVYQTQRILELLFGGGGGHVDLVPEDQEGHVLELIGREEGIQLPLGLGEPAPVDGIDQVHDAVHRGEVILPEPTRRFVSAQIEGLELDVPDNELIRVGVERGDVRLHAVFLEHVK
jgi:hypothetical protein